MPRDLQADLATLGTVLDLAEKREFGAAAALAERTLADGFEHPLLLNVLATRLEQEGRLEGALTLLQRAVALAPGDVGARNALSLCLQRLDRPSEALGHAQELVRRNPHLAFAHVNLGNALIALGELGRAQSAHSRALELEPGNAVAAAALASIATHRGDHPEARRWAERALKSVPGFPDAVLSLASAELADNCIDAAERLLHRLILDPRAGALDKARASGLLGDVLDAAGRFDAAFDAYQACNDALRNFHRSFADAGTLAYTRALTAAVAALEPSRWRCDRTPDSAQNAAGHVFLIGFPRSGTTLLEVILDGHPQLVSLEEHELLIDGVLEFMREPLDLGPLVDAAPKVLDRLREAYWNRVRGAGVDVAGKVFLDKHPLNTLKLPLIARLFPRAKILFACRDPRDVVLSCFRRRFKMNPAMYELLSLPGAAAFYAAVMEFAEQMQRVADLEWRTVRHERLTTDVGQEMGTICEFLGLATSPGMLDFADRVLVRERSTPSTAQLARGLDARGTGHWRRYENHVRELEPVLAPWIERFGHPAATSDPS
jgi:tetratricopeptide (TPR) repeat protein